jgi:hypothetical protein
MGRQSRQPKNLYGGWYCQAPNGVTIFTCDNRKAKWYLDRNLAEKVDEKTIRLKFEPKGMGHAGDEFYLAPRENICVVCGKGNVEFTFHHVIPFCYRTNFPDDVKSHSHHDVLLLCSECHEKYEIEAQKLKREIGEEYGYPVNMHRYTYDSRIGRVMKHASAIVLHRDKMPPEKFERCLRTVKDYYGKEEVSEEEINKAALMNPIQENFGFIFHGDYVAAHITDLPAFIIKWRKHFISTMNPKFMPHGWDINKPIYREDRANFLAWSISAGRS